MWLIYNKCSSLRIKFQSTHPRRVWRNDLITFCTVIGVSIHTPTKGVTCRTLHTSIGVGVSIHTPTKGVTISRKALSEFNDVSIHTPTKGVTSASCTVMAGTDSFNPHTHEGCDQRADWFHHPAAVSIHTPTKGVTLSFGSTLILRLCFNPHTHEGCDIMIVLLMFHPLVFQSTHPRRVWQETQPTFTSITRFQSTHPRRVWPGDNSNFLRAESFNPHTHEGCDNPRAPD